MKEWVENREYYQINRWCYSGFGDVEEVDFRRLDIPLAKVELEERGQE